MKVKLKKLIACKFGVTLYPDKFYDAEKSDDGKKFDVLVEGEKNVWIVVDKKEIKEISHD